MLIDTNKTIKIILEKKDWSWSNTWVESLNPANIERLSEGWFLETKEWFKINISLKFLYDGNVNHNDKVEVEIPRNILRIFVFSVGRVAYNFDVKIPTATIAYEIITKIESQLINDNDWVKNRW